jgi:hypothetical protein
MAHAFLSAPARSREPEDLIRLDHAKVVGDRVVVGSSLSGVVEFHVSDVKTTARGHFLKKGAIALSITPSTIAKRVRSLRIENSSKTGGPCRCVAGCRIECGTGRVVGTCVGNWSQCGS